MGQALDASLILQKSKAIEQEIISWRRYLHERPELGLELPKTREFVVKVLRDLGLEVKEGIAVSGVVGLLRCGKPGKTIAVRADMDALPVTEETGLPYASKHPGQMHACGHDTHVAMVLGTAKVLSSMKDQLSGNVKFVFQPAEEGPGGAKPMIEQGVLEDPHVDAIIGGHVGTLWKVTSGKIGVKYGPLMASSDRFTLTIRGKGGHGATPHLTVDPIVIAAQVVQALQTIVSRGVNPVQPAVVTIGEIKAGTVFNVIPETCVMRGTVRYLDKSLGEFIPKRIEEIAKGIARSMGGDATLEYQYHYPPLVNDKGITDLVREAASEVLGEENVVFLDEPCMGGEDMAYFLEARPGTYIAIGSGVPGTDTWYPNHHPKFTVDEGMLYLGTAVFAASCVKFLNS